MAIYRGPGGAGDANSDITINLVTELTQEAEDHKDAAASSASAAATSAANALTSENNASPVNAIVSEITTVAGISSDVTTVSTNNANVTTVATNIANVNSVAAIDSDVTTVATNDVNVTTVSTNIANVNTVAGINSDVTTVSGISANVTAVAGDATDIGTVASNLTTTDTIGTVAGNIANVNTVAGISSDVTAVVADQADIGTVATNIANVNTVAGVSTDVTTVAGINAAVTAVAADATDIGTVATNIASVNTTAAGITNVNTVATNIAAVQTAGTNIADIQTVAAEVQKVIDVANDLNEVTSEIDVVAASIANVDAVGTNIANVNTVANNLTDVNAFGETYKISATAPTSPTEGDLWYDTTSDILKVYNGGSWQNAGSSVNGTSSRGDFVATSGQTTFTLTGGYDAGYVDVYLNGVKQVPTTDFTATNGSDIVFNVGLTAGDEVSVVAYGTFALADHYTKSQLDGGQLDNRYYTETEVDTLINNIDLSPYAPLASPALTGIPTAPTATTGTNTTQIATTAYVQGELSGISSDAITEGNSSVDVIDTGADGRVVFTTEGTERMRIDASGKVGIGTSSPTSPLHVYGGHNGLSAIIVDDTGVGGGRKWGIRPGLPGVSNGYLTIHDETANATRLTITDTGNVSIAGDLSVSGSIAGAGKVLQAVHTTFNSAGVNGTFRQLSGIDFYYYENTALGTSINKISSTSKIIVMAQYSFYSNGNTHDTYIWRGSVDGTNYDRRHIGYDPYRHTRVAGANNHTHQAVFLGLSTGSHNFYIASGRGDSGTFANAVLNYNPQSYVSADTANENTYSSMVIWEVEV